MVTEIKNILILIPARYSSSRFPGKPLAMLGEQSMIQKVYENCLLGLNIALDEINSGESDSQFKAQGKVVVVTDDSRIEEHLKDLKREVVRVDDDVQSGTERIALAHERYFKQHSWNLIINVQGDEPLLSPADLGPLILEHLKSKFSIMTLVHRMTKDNSESFLNPNRVKVVWSERRKECYYFSRSPIPYCNKDEVPDNWFCHVGVYSYFPEALQEFVSHPVSSLERQERLEQLRALEIGLRIGALEITSPLIGVDVPEDLEKVKGVLYGSNQSA